MPVGAALKTKLDTPHGFVGPRGCADASLYRRLQAAGLVQVQMFPQLVAFDGLHTPVGQWYTALFRRYGRVAGFLDAGSRMHLANPAAIQP